MFGRYFVIARGLPCIQSVNGYANLIIRKGLLKDEPIIFKYRPPSIVGVKRLIGLPLVYHVYRMKSGDFVTKLVRNQTDAYPSSFAPKIFRSLQLAPRIPIFVSFLQKLYKSSHYKLFSSITLMFFIHPVPSQVHK